MIAGHNSSVRILVIEDDPDVADGVATALKRAGYLSEVIYDGYEGETAALMNNYAAILLDWMLPTKDGRLICSTLRSAGITTPILMMTAKDDVPDRVSGLNSGADDYIGKPFAIEELLARIQALIRRDAPIRTSVLNFGTISLDTLAQTVNVSGSDVTLTHREYSLLEALMRNQGRVLSRETILARVFNSDEALPNTVNFHMSSLRKKVDPEGQFIQTVHSFGYVLRRKN